MGPQVSAVPMRRLWSMLAHHHAQQVNLSQLGNSLGVNYKTVQSYMNTLNDFYMVRQIQPWAGNTRKRLVKAPKIYLRDTGLMYRLLNIADFETLLGHPSIGSSWEVGKGLLSKISSITYPTNGAIAIIGQALKQKLI